MALELQPSSDRKRVKVYELKNNDWFDRGTGFCVGQILDVRFDLSAHDRRDSGVARRRARWVIKWTAGADICV